MVRTCGPRSIVGIQTGYGLDGPGSNPGGDQIFRTCLDRPWGPTGPLCNEYRVFPGGKERPGRDADPSPLLVPWSRKSRAIPLLPLWAVRPIQSISACTGCTLTLYLRMVTARLWIVQRLNSPVTNLYGSFTQKADFLILDLSYT